MSIFSVISSVVRGKGGLDNGPSYPEILDGSREFGKELHELQRLRGQGHSAHPWRDGSWEYALTIVADGRGPLAQIEHRNDFGETTRYLVTREGNSLGGHLPERVRREFGFLTAEREQLAQKREHEMAQSRPDLPSLGEVAPALTSPAQPGLGHGHSSVGDQR